MTLKKLYWMTDGRRSQQWIHTSQILAKLHNVHCTKDTELKSPDFFNLHEKAKKQRAPQKKKISFKDRVAASKGMFQRGSNSK